MNHERGNDKLDASIDVLKKDLAELENESFVSLTDSELREKINIIHDGFVLQAPTLRVGTLIYRAVKVNTRPIHRSSISYPPAGAVTVHGRLNRPGEAMFYGALDKFPVCLEECSWSVGELFAVSAWVTTQKMTFNHLGYSSSVLEALKSSRELPPFAQRNEDSERNRLIRDWQARIFTRRVARGQEHLYRPSVALKDLALQHMVQIDSTAPDLFSGVIYPSVAMWLLADNIAILPSEVDTKLGLIEVIFLTLDSVARTRKEGGAVEIAKKLKTYDFSRPDSEGNLIWGQKSQIVYPEGTDASKFTVQMLPPE